MQSLYKILNILLMTILYNDNGLYRNQNKFGVLRQPLNLAVDRVLEKLLLVIATGGLHSAAL
jgi:hypothetical protein